MPFTPIYWKCKHAAAKLIASFYKKSHTIFYELHWRVSAQNKPPDKRLGCNEILVYSWHTTVEAAFKVCDVVVQNEPKLNSHQFQCSPPTPNLIEISPAASEITRQDRPR